MTNNKKSSLKIANGLPLSHYKKQLKRTDLDPAHRKRLEQIIENPLRFGIQLPKA